MKPITVATGSKGLGPDLVGQYVLVVGLNYAPRDTGAAPYTWQVCEDLRRRGAVVQMLAGMPRYPYQSAPRAGDLRLSIDEVAREGVLVSRLRLPVPPFTSRLKRATYESAFATHVLTRDIHWKPDIVVAVVPCLLGAAAAARIARRTGARLVVWVQEFMGPAASRLRPVARGRGAEVTARIEGRLLRQADVVLVFNDDVRRYVEDCGVSAVRIVVRPEWTQVQLPRTDRVAAVIDLTTASDERPLVPAARAGDDANGSVRARPKVKSSAVDRPAESDVALAEIASALIGRE